MILYLWACDVVPSLNVNFFIDSNRQNDITILQRFRTCTTFIHWMFRTMIPGGHTKNRRLWCGNDSRSRWERLVAAYCSTVLSWAELKCSWSELKWTVCSELTMVRAGACLNTALVDPRVTSYLSDYLPWDTYFLLLMSREWPYLKFGLSLSLISRANSPCWNISRWCSYFCSKLIEC